MSEDLPTIELPISYTREELYVLARGNLEHLSRIYVEEVE